MASRELQLAIELCRWSRRNRRPSVVQLGRMAELRSQYEEIAEGHRLPSGVSYEPVNAAGVSAEWLRGPDSRENSVILYLHGGCYATGSVDTHRDLMTRLSIASSMPVLGVNYRLAPRHRFPAAVEDAAAAYRWLLKSGIQPVRIALAGDSAGGGLALALAFVIRDERLPPPAAVVCLSPWIDLALTGASLDNKAIEDPIVSREMLLGCGNLYLGDCDPRTPLASPLYGDLHAIPTLLIQVGAAEVLLSDSTRLAQRGLSAGVDVTLEVWPEMIHVWHSFAEILPEGRRAIEGIATFLQKKVNQRASSA